MTGALKLITDTTADPVTRIEAKAWLRVEEEQVEEDALIDGLITLATKRIEEKTQRSFLVKTFDFFPDDDLTDGCPVPIPKAPLVSVTGIKAFASSDLTDTGGTAMSTSGYYVDTVHEFGTVSPVSGFTFPSPTRTVNPIAIRFTAGYSSNSTGVPDAAKVEIKQLVARLYEHRGDESAIQAELAAYDVQWTDLDLPTWG